MDVVDVVLLLLAAVVFALVTINVATGKINLLALGLFAWVMVALIDAINTLNHG